MSIYMLTFLTVLTPNQTVKLEVRFYARSVWCTRTDSNPEHSDLSLDNESGFSFLIVTQLSGQVLAR